MIVAVFKEQRHDHALEEVWLEYFPTASVGHPANDVMKLLLGQDSIQLDWKLLHANGTFKTPLLRGRVIFFRVLFLGHGAKVTVLVKGVGFA